MPRLIDIVVPVYKSPALTRRCLESLFENRYEVADLQPRVTIINDSPGDPEIEALLAEVSAGQGNVTVLTNETNRGFVHTANRGLDLARRDNRDVLLVNADTETFPGTLQNVVRVAYLDPQIAFVSPRSNNASHCSLPHFYGGRLPSRGEARDRWMQLSAGMPAFHFVPTGVGFYLFIKHGVLANFGLLSTDFGVGYEEENDLILRANKAGYRAVLANHAFAYHSGSASFRLTRIDLREHQERNLRKIAAQHSEYLPLVRRYEASAHFRAEELLGAWLPDASGRVKLIFDCSHIGPNHNGTSELSVAVLKELSRRHGASIDLSVLCSLEAYEYHDLHRQYALRRHDVRAATTERFAIAIRLGQPFDVHSISMLERLAPINLIGMLDTIAEDCGYLSLAYELDELWGHVARHANGLLFISQFSQQTFLARHPEAASARRYARLLPTKLNSYEMSASSAASEHVLVMGNHFAHKASAHTANLLAAAFPTVRFVVLGKETFVSGNVIGYQSGELRQEQVDSLMRRAGVVVLPSHVEGFGFGLPHALAAGKVAVVRDIPATREILASYESVRGVFIYTDDSDLVESMTEALQSGESRIEDGAAEGWEEWVDGLVQFCWSAYRDPAVFARLVARIQAGDMLRRASGREDGKPQAQAAPVAGEGVARAAASTFASPLLVDSRGKQWIPAREVSELLALDGAEFICGAYVTLFGRLPDPEGLENYIGELKSGISKLQILRRLRRSDEGSRVGATLKGMTYETLRWRAQSWLRGRRGQPDQRDGGAVHG